MLEADVRAEVLDPLLRRLGYSLVGEATIRREHPLKYDKLFLGRKKPGKDLKLQGNADYTLEVGRHARWTLEAKAPSEALDEDVRQQAWSYAIHPEVQASYFAVCNGRVFELYSTSAAWDAEPLLRLSYPELLSQFEQLAAWLGPAQIARKHPDHLVSAGKSLGGNLRAFERVASGYISYEKSSLGAEIPLLEQMQVSVVDGSIRRDSTGKIRADLLTKGPFRSIQQVVDDMGLQVQSYYTEDEVLSVNPAAPTVFTYEDEQLFSAGMDPQSYAAVQLPMQLRVLVRAKATGVLVNDLFSGDFSVDMLFQPPGALRPMPVQAEGKFQLRLV